MRALLTTLTLTLCAVAAAQVKIDFNQGAGEKGLPKGWTSKGTDSSVPETAFSVVEDDGEKILRVKSVKGKGGIFKDFNDVDLKKTPVMRWKWKATTLPEGGDGRFDDKGDQAIDIYVLTGGVLAQKAIMYTYETETPKGASKSFSLYLGSFKAKWFCVRDKRDGTGEWFVDQRNVAKDFKDTYGEIPSKVAVMIYGKSDKTGTESEAELAWIEFLPEPDAE